MTVPRDFCIPGSKGNFLPWGKAGNSLGVGEIRVDTGLGCAEVEGPEGSSEAFPVGTSGKEPTCQCRSWKRLGFKP